MRPEVGSNASDHSPFAAAAGAGAACTFSTFADTLMGALAAEPLVRCMGLATLIVTASAGSEPPALMATERRAAIT